MYFQEPSLLQFQQQMEERAQQNNLRTLFGVNDIPKTNALKDILDEQDSQSFNSIFKGIARRLQRSKQLNQFNFYNGLTICSIDATQYHSSESIRCKHCLTKHKDNKDKPTIYQHFALQTAFMHPNLKQVIPVMAEPIGNTDGAKKQDCEINAAKRLIPLLRNQFPKKGLIITGDDLFSRQPMIESVQASKFHYFFVAKPTSHKYLMEWLDSYDQLNKYEEFDKQGRIIRYQWMNNVPLNGDKNAIRVNFFRKQLLSVNSNGKESIHRAESWVSDLEVNRSNVSLFVSGAKSRWKIENECFNTLKNQGYHLEHNYGHGEKNLAFNFYLLTLLAFLFHQVFEVCDADFQASRKKAGSKRSLWEKFRTLMEFFIFESWDQLLGFYLHRDDYRRSEDGAVKLISEQPPPA
jgi:hypothetical protein